MRWGFGILSEVALAGRLLSRLNEEKLEVVSEAEMVWGVLGRLARALAWLFNTTGMKGVPTNGDSPVFSFWLGLPFH